MYGYRIDDCGHYSKHLLCVAIGYVCLLENAWCIPAFTLCGFIALIDYLFIY